MATCCRANDADPDLEYFTLIERVAHAIRRRSPADLHKDTETPMKVSRYRHIKDAILHLEQTLGKKIEEL